MEEYKLACYSKTDLSNDFGRPSPFGQNFKNDDLGLTLGIHLLENKPISISVRYIHGLRNLVEGTYVDRLGQKTDYKDFKNRVFQVSLKYNLSSLSRS